MEIKKALKYFDEVVANRKWIFSKRYAKFAPHEYIVTTEEDDICSVLSFILDSNSFFGSLHFHTCIMLFSYNYMNPLILFTILKRCRQVIMVIYDRPYLKGSSSYYAGRKWYYLYLHFIKNIVIKIILRILKSKIFLERQLTNDPYYKLYILQNQDGSKNTKR